MDPCFGPTPPTAYSNVTQKALQKGVSKWSESMDPMASMEPMEIQKVTKMSKPEKCVQKSDPTFDLGYPRNDPILGVLPGPLF